MEILFKYSSTWISGDTIISISVDNLFGMPHNKIKLVPPLKINFKLLLAKASNSPKAKTVRSKILISILFEYFECNKCKYSAE